MTLDDDLQHNPSDITKLYQTIKEDDDLDAVFGKPAVKEHGIVRNIGSLFIKKVNEQIFRKPKNLTMSLLNKMDNHFTVLWDGGHIKFWSKRTLSKLLKEFNFEMCKFKGSGRIPLLWKSMFIVAKLK